MNVSRDGQTREDLSLQQSELGARDSTRAVHTAQTNLMTVSNARCQTAVRLHHTPRRILFHSLSVVIYKHIQHDFAFPCE
jgi:hypothetical protein